VEREMAEKRRVAQERKAALEKAKEEEKARKAEEARLKAEAQEKEKAEAERQAKEAERKAQEAWQKAKAGAGNKAERVRLENRQRLYCELIQYKERTEAEARKKAEEKEKNKAGDGMMLATPADLSALERARIVNAENARVREESHKPKAGSSKTTPMPTAKTKAPVNLTRQVREQERLRKTGKLGKSGDVAVRISFWFSSAFLTCVFLQDVMCDNCTSQIELCVYRSWVACLICQQRKVRCSFLDARRKRKNEEINSEEDEGGANPEKAKGWGV
jgi:hypothetical protein